LLILRHRNSSLILRHRNSTECSTEYSAECTTEYRTEYCECSTEFAHRGSRVLLIDGLFTGHRSCVGTVTLAPYVLRERERGRVEEGEGEGKGEKGTWGSEKVKERWGQEWVRERRGHGEEGEEEKGTGGNEREKGIRRGWRGYGYNGTCRSEGEREGIENGRWGGRMGRTGGSIETLLIEQEWRRICIRSASDKIVE
jgi:hypothetical protein